MFKAANTKVTTSTPFVEFMLKVPKSKGCQFGLGT